MKRQRENYDTNVYLLFSGFAIYLNLKYGGKELSHLASELTAPATELIGVFSADLEKFRVVLVDFAKVDKKKAKKVLKWLIKNDENMKQDLRHMLKTKLKLDADHLPKKRLVDLLVPRIQQILNGH